MAESHDCAFMHFHEVQGISIRFPRLVRVRDDKSPEDATSATQVRRSRLQEAAPDRLNSAQSRSAVAIAGAVPDNNCSGIDMTALLLVACIG